MRVMVILKATTTFEAGTVPSAYHIAAMGKFHSELVKAGVMLAGGVLHPSSNGKRIVVHDAQCRVIVTSWPPEPS